MKSQETNKHSYVYIYIYKQKDQGNDYVFLVKPFFLEFVTFGVTSRSASSLGGE